MSQPLNSQSQEIGDDIAALCTGKFYDNPFVTLSQGNFTANEQEDKNDSKESNENITLVPSIDTVQKQNMEINDQTPNDKQEKIKLGEDGNILKSILDELNEPEIETTNKFFVRNEDNQIKKRFVIDSDEENEEGENKERKKKFKKRKPEKRALQISGL